MKCEKRKRHPQYDGGQPPPPYSGIYPAPAGRELFTAVLQHGGQLGGGQLRQRRGPGRRRRGLPGDLPVHVPVLWHRHRRHGGHRPGLWRRKAGPGPQRHRQPVYRLRPQHPAHHRHRPAAGGAADDGPAGGPRRPGGDPRLPPGGVRGPCRQHRL